MEDITGEQQRLIGLAFPEERLKTVKIPEHKLNEYTDETKRAFFLKHCQDEGIRLGYETNDIKGAEESLINKATDIIVGRSDRQAVEFLFANFAHRFAISVINDRTGRPRSFEAKKEEMPEIKRRRQHTYRSLWQGVQRRG